MKTMRAKISLMRAVGLLIAFAMVISIAHAYSYNDYYRDEVNRWDDEEGNADAWDDDDAVGYYDYAGQWHEIPEPDPIYGYGYGHHRASSPISVMMPGLIISFVLFWLWVACALARGEDGD